jgi:NADPH2:quinone reductase
LLSDNADLDVRLLAVAGVIAAYASRSDRPELPFWPLLFANVTHCLLGSDDLPSAAKQRTADLTAAADGALAIPIADPLPLEEIAAAHDHVDSGGRHRVLLAVAGPHGASCRPGTRLRTRTGPFTSPRQRFLSWPLLAA